MQIFLPIADVPVDLFVLLILGAAVGFLSGVFGIGGGFLMTPLLILLGIPAAVAVATEANQIAASSFSGVLAHLKRRAVDFKMGNILVVGGLLGPAVGVEVFRIIKSYGQIELFVSLCYILFLGSIGTLMFLESLSTIQKSRKSENNFKQALFPKEATIIPNMVGTAPGMIWEPIKGFKIITFPGVPLEMKEMWNNFIQRIKNGFTQK